MISNIKIFKRYEDSHGNASQNGIEQMSPNDYDISVHHESYNDLVNQINKSVNDIFFDVKILRIWQKQEGQTLDISRDTYERILSRDKLCVLLKVTGNTSQADMETIMKNLKERIENLERTIVRTKGVEETARWHAKHYRQESNPSARK
jgi:hypothetical protein